MEHSHHGPPYASSAAVVGGLPTVAIDVPICAVFLAIYLGFAILNTVIAEVNRRKGHKFLISRAVFGFCMARTGTIVLRIAWATRHQNIRLGIAAQIFNNVGVLVIYAVNLILAQRILRAKQPHLGWSAFLKILHKTLYVTLVLEIALVIAAVVWSVYTLDTQELKICREIQLAAITYLLVFTCIPFCYMIASAVLPTSDICEKFGAGSFASKYLILASSTISCMLIAAFKTGTAWSAPRSITDPAWFDSKAAYYGFGFTIEIIIVATLTLGRIDKRFFVPNGCQQAGDFSRLQEVEKDLQ